MKEGNPKPNLADLRRRAEEMLSRRPEELQKTPSEDVQLLIHQLQVHQIELELQNEELRRTQQELSLSRDRYFDLYDLAPVGYFTIDEKGLIVQCNLTGVNLLEMERDALLKMPFSRFVFAEDQDTYYFHRRQLLEADPRQSCDLRMVKQDGTPFHARLECTAIHDEHGNTHLRAIVTDVTARVQAEEALRTSNRRLAGTLAELEEMQERLVQQERLAAVGQLAAGIAHDFNNFLASITLYSQMSLRAPGLPPRIGEHLKVIVEETRRAADLVQQVLDFSRRSVINRRPLTLAPLLEEIVGLLERTLPENIRIDLICGPGEYIISADPTRIQQAVVNLALNARDAMPKGGELRIALSRTTGAEETRCTTCGEIIKGAWILLAVTDTGTGIAPDVLSRIFEPFFTTKAPLGHGLGLAQAYGIMKQHEGHVKVETQAGHGTTFTLYWPALSETRSEEQSQAQPVAAQGQGECILIVEDNVALRAALAGVLEMLNYRVLEAANGREALAVLDQHRDRVRLVISDRVMPVMGGLELVQELRQRQLQVKVLMLTGYPLSESTRESTPEGVVGWVQKPPSLEQLSERVAWALAEGPELTVRANDD